MPITQLMPNERANEPGFPWTDPLAFERQELRRGVVQPRTSNRLVDGIWRTPDGRYGEPNEFNCACCGYTGPMSEETFIPLYAGSMDSRSFGFCYSLCASCVSTCQDCGRMTSNGARRYGDLQDIEFIDSDGTEDSRCSCLVCRNLNYHVCSDCCATVSNDCDSWHGATDEDGDYLECDDDYVARTLDQILGRAPVPARIPRNSGGYLAHDEDSYGESSTRRSIHDYSYKPAPLFKPELPKGLRYARSGQYAETGTPYIMNGRVRSTVAKSSLAYFGIELETESGLNLTNASVLAQSLSHSEDDYYLKCDASLRNGFELVSHPRTLENWREFVASSFTDTLTALSRAGVRAWNNPSCGLHVHISRVAFDNQAHVARFLYLFESHPKEAKQFAQRETHYARFQGTNTNATIALKVKGGYGEHSDAVNITNSDTIEVRIFRPSLKGGRILAAIELCHAALEFTRINKTKAIIEGNFTWDRLVLFMQESGTTYANALHAQYGGQF